MIGTEPRTWIVIPTYNERATVPALLDEVRSYGPFEVLVVDDNSPDGTGDVLDGMRAERPWLHVLHRQAKEGLGAAYRAGCRVALDGGADIIIHMDADHSHPPALIPALLHALDGRDLAIASRYVAGGTMHIDPWRRLVSGVGNAYLRWALGTDVHDWSTGYKAWRRTALERALNEPPRAAGYAWLMEMTWKARRSGARIGEVPLQFAVRAAGTSKFSWAILLEDIRVAWDLRRAQ